MKATDLVNLWSAPDNSRLTAKQSSFRLPVHVAAKLAALCELYPNRTRTEIVGDLLSAALADVERALPVELGPESARHPETSEALYEPFGPKIRFRQLANQHFHELERELGNEAPADLYPSPDALVTAADKV